MTNTWRELLYPAEWGFRFAITALLVAIINSLSSIDYALLYYALWIGMAICFLLQLRITILALLGKIPTPGLSNA
ncbi:hypothetical protein [Methanogenium organophilum]|uniref:Uncharacterized protein n=1 Tax=Methanogenium organophilum TaxID=2199 RepID=A0A9X9T7M5_METOG|nr:hypothetical protein [Methanogenium organophilum]WAI00551.1 hypothetical protein OU421_08930 [Methanogenium organophilum]